jgi:hypothetical protein
MPKITDARKAWVAWAKTATVEELREAWFVLTDKAMRWLERFSVRGKTYLVDGNEYVDLDTSITKAPTYKLRETIHDEIQTRFMQGKLSDKFLP